jgi:hypothetical protein
VIIPAEIAYELARELRKSPLRGMREQSERRLDRLAEYIDEGRVLHGQWSALQDILGQALREALDRPGAEGIAARDDLLAMLRRFANIHQDATNPDDPGQIRPSVPD